MKVLIKERLLISELEVETPVVAHSFHVQESLPPPPPSEAPPPLRRSNMDEEGFKPPDILKRWQRSTRSGRSSSSNSLDSDADKRLSSSSLHAEASSIRFKSSSFQNLCSKFDDSEVVVKKGPPVPPKPNRRSPNEVKGLNPNNFSETSLNIENKFSYGPVSDKSLPLWSMSEDDAMQNHLQPKWCRSPVNEGINSKSRHTISVEPGKTSQEHTQLQTDSSDVRDLKPRGNMSDKYVEASVTLSRNSSQNYKEPSKNKWNTSFDKPHFMPSTGDSSNLSRQKSSSTTNLAQNFQTGNDQLRRYVSQEDGLDQPGRLIKTRENSREQQTPSKSNNTDQRETKFYRKPQIDSNGSVRIPRVMVNKYGIQNRNEENNLDSFRVKRAVSDRSKIRMPRRGTPVMKKWPSETSFHLVDMGNDNDSDLDSPRTTNSLTSMFPWQTDLGRHASFKSNRKLRNASCDQIHRISREFSSDEAESSNTSSLEDRLGSKTGSSGDSIRFGTHSRLKTGESDGQNHDFRSSAWVGDIHLVDDEVDFDAQLRSITQQLEIVRQQFVEKRLENSVKVKSELLCEGLTTDMVCVVLTSVTVWISGGVEQYNGFCENY